MRPRRPYYESGQLQFITSSVYRRTPVFKSPRFCQEFVRVLSELRPELGFGIMGWVLMPEHFHLLLKPEPAGSTTLIIQQLKPRTAAAILRTLQENRRYPGCDRMLSRFRLPNTVHDQGQKRVGQRRFYPFKVYSEKKRLEKLHYMHGNPVKRGLVDSPDQWPWSSWRFYHWGDASILRMDRPN